MIIIEGVDSALKLSLSEEILRAEPMLKPQQVPEQLGADWDYFWDFLPLIRPISFIDNFIINAAVHNPDKVHPSYIVPLEREVLSAGGITILVVETADDSPENEAFMNVAKTGSIDNMTFFHIDFVILDVELKTDIASLAEYIVQLHSFVANRSAFLKGTKEFPSDGIYTRRTEAKVLR